MTPNLGEIVSDLRDPAVHYTYWGLDAKEWRTLSKS